MKSHYKKLTLNELLELKKEFQENETTYRKYKLMPVIDEVIKEKS